MPQRRKNTTLVTEDDLVEAVVARVTDQFNQQLDTRFARLELAFERGAAPAVSTTPQPPPVSVTTDKRPAENSPDDGPPAPKRSAQAPVSSHTDPSLSSIPRVGDSSYPEMPGTLRPASQQPSRAAITAPDPASVSAVNNNNPTWKAWLAATERAQATNDFSSHYRPHLVDNTGSYDHDIDAQVRHILEVTPHQLKGNVPTGIYPFKYITRGPEKKKLSFNSLSLPEHILGMFRIIEDERLDPSIKPYILGHMKEVVEDAAEFDWNGHVRRWSEEVFDLIAEGRLPGGWAAQSKIQNLRTGMSRVNSARTSNPRDYVSSNNLRKPATTGSQNELFKPTHQNEVFRGGPPCPQFNSFKGCQLPSGHLQNGKKQIHVCSYCLANTANAHPHSESQCRTKQRHASHF